MGGKGGSWRFVEVFGTLDLTDTDNNSDPIFVQGYRFSGGKMSRKIAGLAGVTQGATKVIGIVSSWTPRCLSYFVSDP